jgi:hypothetical protein
MQGRHALGQRSRQHIKSTIDLLSPSQNGFQQRCVNIG